MPNVGLEDFFVKKINSWMELGFAFIYEDNMTNFNLTLKWAKLSDMKNSWGSMEIWVEEKTREEP